jgi:hypothetical protein
MAPGITATADESAGVRPGVVFLMLANKALSDAFDTPSIMLLTWSSVFGLIGLAFLQSATRAPSGPFAMLGV